MAHLHEVLGDDPHFKIDPDTRVIIRTSENEPILIQNDHNSERFTFEIPKFVDGHDMELCDVIRVHFINISAENSLENALGLYEVDDLHVSADDESTMVFSWLLSREATTLVGTLSFLVEFICKKDGNVIDYSWHTGIYTGGIVSPGIDNTDSVIGQYYDVLNHWVAIIEQEGNKWVTTINQEGDLVRTDVLDRINAAAKEAENTSIAVIDARANEVKMDLTIHGINVNGLVVQETGNSDQKIMSQASVTKELNSLDSDMNTKFTGVNSEINVVKTEMGKIASAVDQYVEIPILDNYDTLGLVEGHYRGAYIEIGKTYVIENKVSEGWTFGVNMFVEFMDTNGEMSSPGQAYVNILNHLPFDYVDGYPSIRIVDFKLQSPVSSGDRTIYAIINVVYNGVAYKITNSVGIAPANTDRTYYVTRYKIGICGPESFSRLFEVKNHPQLQSDFLANANANGITNITKTNMAVINGVVTHTYTILLDDGTTTSFDVKDGVGISSIYMLYRDDYQDTYRVDLTNGTHKTFTIPNNNSVGIVTSTSGVAIHATGMLCLEHKVKVQVRSADPSVDLSTVTLRRCGKNILPPPTIETGETKSGVTLINNGDGTITLNGTATNSEYLVLYDGSTRLSGTYTLSGLVGGSGSTYYINAIINYGSNILTNGSTTINAKSSGTLTKIELCILSGAEFDNVTISPMLEVGDTATEFEEYVGTTYGITSDGTPASRVTSLTPTMNLLVDTLGVMIDATYNLDQTVAYNQMYNAVENNTNARIEFESRILEAINGVEEELRMIYEGGVE